MRLVWCETFTAAAIICALTVSSAAAEISSVDAYAGQAAVLGKPNRPRSHRSGAPRRGAEHPGQTSGSGSSSGSGGSSSGSGGSTGSGATAGSKSSGTSGQAGGGTAGAGNATTPVTAGAPATEQPARVAGESASALP